jgi:hypothetical protein
MLFDSLTSFVAIARFGSLTPMGAISLLGSIEVSETNTLHDSLLQSGSIFSCGSI